MVAGISLFAPEGGGDARSVEVAVDAHPGPVGGDEIRALRVTALLVGGGVVAHDQKGGVLGQAAGVLQRHFKPQNLPLVDAPVVLFGPLPGQKPQPASGDEGPVQQKG